MSDFRYVLRSLWRSRGFALAVLLTLGLGIGANTAIFSVVRGVLLRGLPHKDGDRLVYLRQSSEGAGGDNVAFSVPEIADFRDAAKTLGAIAEYSPITLTLLGEQDAIRVDVGLVTGNYLSVMGLSPILGRPFQAGDDGPTAAPVLMLTPEFFQRRFGADRGILGKTLRIGGKTATVIGVVQPAPFFPGRVDAFGNMVLSDHHVSATMVTGRTHRMTEMMARLAPGATVEQARAEVRAISERVHREHPEAYDAGSHFKVTVTPFREVLGERAQLTLWLLLGASAFVLVIACANVANLTLIRAIRRDQELVVRASLGAGAGRLRRLLLVENLTLALLGGLLGVGFAYAGAGLLTTFAARYSPRAGEIRIDAAVLGFALLLAVVVAVLLSFAPSLGGERTASTALAGGDRRSTGGVRGQRLQRALVVAQVAVSIVLLTAAGLLVRTMQRLAAVDSGLASARVLTMEVPADFGSGEDPRAAIGRYERMERELQSLPGVAKVGIGSTVPLRLAGFVLEVKADGRATQAGEAVPRAEYRTASPQYFGAAGIPLLRGRDFTTTDQPSSGPVVILNQTLADQLFPNQDPIGRRVAWTGDVLKFIGVSDGWRTVVGVVGDTKDGGPDAPAVPVMFIPFAQGDFPGGGLVIKTQADAAAVAPAATRVVRAIDARQPIEHVLTLDQIRDESVAPRRLNAQLIAGFGILALVVAAIGIAGVLAFSISTRIREIGIRMSLGADRRQVLRMVLGEGGLLVGLGLGAGIAAVLALARLMRGLLFGVAPHDPLTLAAVALLMAVVGVGACWVPAARAARIEPSEALRAQ